VYLVRLVQLADVPLPCGREIISYFYTTGFLTGCIAKYKAKEINSKEYYLF